MRIVSAASWIKRRGRRMMSIQSVRLCRPSGSFPLSRCLCWCGVPLPFRLLTSSMISCLHRILCRLCPPHRGYTPRHPSIMLAQFSACRFAFLIAFPRFASRPAPRVDERGDVVLRALAACFPCPCDVVSDRRRERAAACFAMSAMRSVNSDGA